MLERMKYYADCKYGEFLGRVFQRALLGNKKISSPQRPYRHGLTGTTGINILITEYKVRTAVSLSRRKGSSKP